MQTILKFITSSLASALLLTGAAPTLAEEEPQPAMVVIIDDLGDNLRNGLGAVNLPGPVTLAIMPHTPFGPRLANAGHQLGKEIMLHAPMENHAGMRLGPGGLTSDMNETLFKETLTAGIASIPHVEGINNHMGSALTEKAQPMNWTMDVVAGQGLFFIDSRTSAKSVALKKAKANKIASQSRDVFLDNDTTPEALQKQFNQALRIANRYGSVILIGHTYPASIKFLQENLPKLDEMGIRLVSASALLYDVKYKHQRPLVQLAEVSESNMKGATKEARP